MPETHTRGPSPRRHLRRALRASEDLWVTPLMTIVPLLHDFGVDPSSVLSTVGVNARVLADPSNRLPFDLVGRLVAECARATKCPHFGLLVGQRSGIASAGPAGELARHSATAGEGVRVLIAHLQLHDRGAILALNARAAAQVELAYVIHHPDTPGAAQILDAAMAIGFAIMQSLCGPRWVPTAVTLSRSRPGNVAPYQSFFRAPVRFDAARSALIFPARWLKQPVASADPAERDRLSKLVAELEAARPVTVTEQVIRALSHVVIAMPPSSNEVARAIGLSPRTLSRRLEAEGTNFRELLEDVRFALARQLLEESRMPIGEIAATLHYSAPEAFSRAFKAWTGETPRQRRTSGRRWSRVGRHGNRFAHGDTNPGGPPVAGGSTSSSAASEGPVGSQSSATQID